MLDWTPPIIGAVGSLVTVNDAPAGTADTISGAAGAVMDNLSPTDAITVGLRDELLTSPTTVTTQAAAADGSFGPLGVGDNQFTTLTLTAVDEAGNESTAPLLMQPFAPRIVITPFPAAAADGVASQILVDISDDVADLSANPEVTVAGQAASLISGDLSTAGTTQRLVYATTLNQAMVPEGPAIVIVRATNTLGNTNIGVAQLEADYTAPSSTLVVPVAGEGIAVSSAKLEVHETAGLEPFDGFDPELPTSSPRHLILRVVADDQRSGVSTQDAGDRTDTLVVHRLLCTSVRHGDRFDQRRTKAEMLQRIEQCLGARAVADGYSTVIEVDRQGICTDRGER